MIIACPACATRYEVPDSAVGPNGRTVRCAKCRHSWFADASAALPPEEPESGSANQVGTEVQASASGQEGVVSAESVSAEENSAHRPEAEPVAESVGTTAPEFTSAFEDQDIEADPAPRRSRWRFWAWAAVIVIVIGGATAAAASYLGLPDWLPVQRANVATSQSGLKLDFPADRQERRQLPNGTEFFGASGTITNVDGQEQTVPPILIVLRDERDRIVFSWEVAPPKRRLAPGESITINEAITDVPPSARVAEIGWKPV